MKLSILVVTERRPYARSFLDDAERLAVELTADLVLYDGRNAGAIEHVLDAAVATCSGEYVLRLDDDERASEEMREWLAEREYLAREVWSFPRANLWPDAEHYITTDPLWPDLQTRLTVRDKAGGRRRIHDGSPYGPGGVAPVVLEHHKFLVRPRHERELLVAKYETLQPGAGRGWVEFSVPEAFDLAVAPYPARVPA